MCVWSGIECCKIYGSFVVVAAVCSFFHSVLKEFLLRANAFFFILMLRIECRFESFQFDAHRILLKNTSYAIISFIFRRIISTWLCAGVKSINADILFHGKMGNFNVRIEWHNVPSFTNAKLIYDNFYEMSEKWWYAIDNGNIWTYAFDKKRNVVFEVEEPLKHMAWLPH